MDEAKVGAAVVMCYKCLSTDHTYKRCTVSVRNVVPTLTSNES
jgi:hypothetical protein